MAGRRIGQAHSGQPIRPCALHAAAARLRPAAAESLHAGGERRGPVCSVRPGPRPSRRADGAHVSAPAAGDADGDGDGDADDAAAEPLPPAGAPAADELRGLFEPLWRPRVRTIPAPSPAGQFQSIWEHRADLDARALLLRSILGCNCCASHAHTRARAQSVPSLSVCIIRVVKKTQHTNSSSASDCGVENGGAIEKNTQ